MGQPTFTVIVTSYNYERFIGQAVQSVLDQTYRDFEVIVVDDGSTDGSLDILRRFGDAITTICQTNKGKSAALNAGVASSRGKYLAFLDSDDYWPRDSLAARVAAFERHPEVGVIYGQAAVVDESGASMHYSIGSPERFPGETLLSLLYGNFIPFVTFTVKKAYLDSVGGQFDPEFGAANDWQLHTRLSQACQFHYVDRTLGYWRLHGGNWSGKPEIMADEMTRLVEGVLSQPDVPQSVRQSEHLLRRNLYTNLGLGFIGPGPRSRALFYFAKAILISRRRSWAATRIVYLLLVSVLNRTPKGASLVRLVAEGKRRFNYTIRTKAPVCK